MGAVLVTPQNWKTASPIYTQLALGNHVYNVHNAGSGYRYDPKATYALTSKDGNAVRFEVRYGDTNWYDIDSGKERSEISSTEHIDYGTPLHVSYNFTVEPGAKNSAVWVVVGQLHHDFQDDENVGPPPFAIELKGEKMMATIRYNDETGAQVVKQIFLDATDIVRGHAYKMDIYASFDNSTNESRMVVVRDGTVIADYKGPLGFSADGQVYWKEGIYRYHAPETLAVTYSDLQITKGDMVQIPAVGSTTHVLSPAPTLTFDAATLVDGEARVGLSGAAAPNTTVAIFDNEEMVGTTTTDANGRYVIELKPDSALHFLTAATIDASGNISAASGEVPVEVGTAADIVLQMTYLAKMPTLGAIFATDSHTLVVGSLAEMKTMIAEAKQALGGIVGGYNFGFWSGTPNYRTFTTYDTAGKSIEAYTASVRDGVTVQLTHNVYTPGANVTMEITAFHITGQPYSWAYRAFTTGNKQIVLEQYRDDNTLYYAKYTYADGSTSARSFDATGSIVTNTITDADGTIHLKQYANGFVVSEQVTYTDGRIVDVAVDGTEPAPVQAVTTSDPDGAIAKSHQGDDIYLVRSPADTIFEAAHGGTDTVYTALHQYTLGAHLENLVYAGTGGATLTGNASDNALTGGAADDVLDGGTGADTMTGLGGNDIYVVDNAGDVVVEAADGGIDTVRTTLASYTLPTNVEVLTYLGAGDAHLFGNGLANTITGGAGSDVLDGKAGADVLIGGLGDDTYIVDDAGDVVVEEAGGGRDLVFTTLASYTVTANVENVTFVGAGDARIVGNDLSNTITTGSGNDTLDGGQGADLLVGGLGDDTYIVDDAGDSIVEGANAGTDTVLTTLASYELGNDLENLTFIGTGSARLIGNAAANVIMGGQGDDYIDGGLGADTMRGGGGNDVFVVDDVGDVVEVAPGAGIETVRTSLSTYTLDAYVNNLVYTGALNAALTGNALGNMLTGGAGNDTIDGGQGADTMQGGNGDDVYIVDHGGDVVMEYPGGGTDTVRTSLGAYTLTSDVEALIYVGIGDVGLIGNAGANTIQGGIGNDTLDGGTGIDSLLGGAGNDTYYVDDSRDVVVEFSGEGNDLVVSTVSFKLGDHLERLTLAGTAAIDGTGNDLSNTLTGNNAANVLDGGLGADRMVGGGGNDTYIVDDAGDIVVEVAGGGVDLVVSSVSHTLAAEVENLTLTGSGAISGTGNALNNILIGNAAGNVLFGGAGADTLNSMAGNDTLRGGAGDDSLIGGDGNDFIYGDTGADRLSGGAGADTFVFADGDSGRTAQTADRILDFSHAQGDVIDLSAIDANTQVAGNQAFTLFSEKPMVPIAGSLWMTQSYGYYQISGEINGDGVADFVLLVDTVSRSQIFASDFIL